MADILAMDGDGYRPMPLAIVTPGSDVAREVLRKCIARDLFPAGRSPEAALAGLWLYFSFFQEAHEIAQDIETADGSYWHAIVHRQEPDAANASYWFRRTGRHPVFESLATEARRIAGGGSGGFSPGAVWDPLAFIDFCESSRRLPGSPQEAQARAIQQAEWQALFDYCAAPSEPVRRS